MKNHHIRAAVLAAILFSTGVQLLAQPVTQIPATASPGVLNGVVSDHQDTLTSALSSEIKPLPVLTAMQRVADWQLAHVSTATNRPATGWVQATGDAGIMALAGISGDAKYRDAMLALGETNDWKLGHRLYDADDHCIGQTWAELYLLYRAPKMIAPLREKFDAILANPSTNQTLAYAKKEDPKVRENWAWCDSLFMAPPAWVRLYAATGDEKYLNFAVKSWWRTTDFLYDTNEHLFFRDSTYFKKTEANGKKVFWGRGNGWVLAGLVRVLQYLPTNHPDRPRFEQLFKDMAAKILTCQQPDGFWRTSLLDPESYPLKETSGSGFDTYALAWGVNQGLLDREKFEPAVRQAWAALVSCVDADGKLTHVQPIGSDPNKFAEDATEVYGVGAFLLAGSEVYRLAVIQTTHAKTILPLVDFEDVPITTAIWNLERCAGIEKISFLDRKLDYQGQKKDEPLVSFHQKPWRNYTAEQALYTLLNKYNLRLVEKRTDGVFLVTTQSSDAVLEKFDGGVAGITAINVRNPSTFRRESETVEFNFSEITNGLRMVEIDLSKTSFFVMDGLSSRILDSQVYSTGSNSAPDKLLFQVDLAPGETRTFYILDASALAAVPPPIVKTMARFVPERYDDFAWESDRIAHRTYGLALIKAENTISSGPDVWIKKDRGLIVDTMYATKHYHEDNGSFMDDYRVGHSRGCGGVGIWDGQKLYTSSNYRGWKLITSGPIRSEFELTYDAWDAGRGRMVSETKRYSIDAGSWFTKAQSTFVDATPPSQQKPNGDGASPPLSPLTLGVGLAERACPTNREEFIAHDQSEGWLSYWQPEDKPKGIIGDAIVLARGAVKEFTNDDPNMPDAKKHAAVPQPTHEGYPPIRNLLAISSAEVGKPFEYYFGACWDRSGDFTNHVQWENYVQRFAERRDQPLQVTVGN